MGISDHVGADRFPPQGSLIGKRVEVCFDYSPTPSFRATCIRDDLAEPWLTIFRMDDERTVLATECQYRPLP